MEIYKIMKIVIETIEKTFNGFAAVRAFALKISCLLGIYDRIDKNCVNFSVYYTISSTLFAIILSELVHSAKTMICDAAPPLLSDLK